MESEHLKAAEQQSCAALVTLEAIPELSANQIAGGGRQITRAIQCLRQVIVELREAHDEQVATLALGFVAGRDSSLFELGCSVQPPPDRVDSGLNATWEAEFHQDAGDVVLGSTRTDIQGLGDLRVLHSARD